MLRVSAMFPDPFEQVRNETICDVSMISSYPISEVKWRSTCLTCALTTNEDTVHTRLGTIQTFRFDTNHQ